MTTSLTQWRRRCIAAEERAFAAETQLKKTTENFRLSVNATNAVNASLQKASTELRKAQRILKRVASRHLGEGASAAEIDALVERWMTHDTKREAKTAPTGMFWISLGGSALSFESPDDGDDDHDD